MAQESLKQTAGGTGGFKKILTTEFYLLIFLVAILVVMAIAAPDFYSVNTIMTVLNYFSYLLIAAIGMNIIIITSNIDVAAGSIMSVVAIVIAFVGKTGAPLPVFMLVGMAAGLILSWVNGLFITKLKIPAIVATLATTQLFVGALPLVVEGSIYDLPASFTWLAFKAKLFGVLPASVVFAAVITVGFMLFMRYSRFSKKLYAVGNNIHAATLTGINVNKVMVLAFVIAGPLYGIAGTIIATGGQRVTTTMANGFEMTLIAAVVLGGTSIAGGSGKIIGTVLGAFILSLITPAMNYIGLSSDWSDAVMGGIILLAVIVASISTLTKNKKVIITPETGQPGAIAAAAEVK
ncbi:MAG: ABC transporter permease [Clostridiales Family XIII bacterium]|jgi:ribose/xylose/arabinose/galactoside ABC-type transport system permease subunit|nr:ABC transporter permease [Clostridiales Family XIII bacterium]